MEQEKMGQAAVLVGIEKYRDQMLQTFEEMKKVDGSYLSYYLNTVTKVATQNISDIFEKV
uniref:Uncharacterized protein n=1 Tax=Romanomermis culicivorax TaxID=13658 RepID=A0A915L0D0_ROMCU